MTASVSNTNKILVAEPSEFFFDGLHLHIKRCIPSACFKQVKNLDQALAELKSHSYYMVFIDASLITGCIPQFSALIKTLRQTTFMYLGSNCYPQMLDAFNLGFRGYLIKNECKYQLRDAISTVAAGNEYIPQQIKEFLARLSLQHIRPVNNHQSTQLTDCELLILKKVCDGFSSEQIAEYVNRDIQTINTHRRHIARKIGSSKEVDYLKYAVRNYNYPI